MAEEVFPWLESLPLAPEYHPTLSEFQNPIAYIMKIEPEASKFGICKIVPPLSSSPKKTIVANLSRSLSSQNPDSKPTFTTRLQQIGFCPQKHHRWVDRLVRERDGNYTISKFEAKAKAFENKYLKKGSNAERELTALEVETLYWKAQMGKPFTVEYGNDLIASAFDQTGGGHGSIKQGKEEKGDVMRVVGDSEWNMRVVARTEGSLFKFVKMNIEGVTSPMVYISMLFSWFAWHVEDHEFHSLNYMHMGAAKTWYGVPVHAAVAFEDLVRDYGYGGEISPLATYTILAGKNTIMSPEILVKAGVPCYRLVQNAGDLVITFPRAYHTGFSHGFNCGEAVNLATPNWLRIARDAAIRRAAIRFYPMVSHSQLLCDLALSLSSRHEPQSSRLTDTLKPEGSDFVKRLFVEDMVKNNKLLHVLSKGSAIVPLTKDALEGVPMPYIGVTIRNDDMESTESSDSASPSRNNGIKKQDEKPNPASKFGCAACGVLCYHCVAIVQPTEEAARHLISAMTDGFTTNKDANMVDPEFSSEDQMPKSAHDQTQALYDNVGKVSPPRAQEINASLRLLALNYGSSSDSEEEHNIVTDKYSFDPIDASSLNESDSDEEWDCSKAKAITPARNWPTNPVQVDDLLNTHIFCLEHAAEVEERLRSVGGVHIMLLCHQDYPKMEAEAILIAKELRTDYVFADLGYIEAKKSEKNMIRLALDDDEAKDGNRDWTVVLGFNIYYSSKVSFSRFYTEQMHFNSVIYDAFEKSSSTFDALKAIPEVGMELQRRFPATKAVRKRKKNVALPLSPPPAEDLLPDGGGKRRSKHTRKTVVEKKAREPDMVSGDENDDGTTPTRRVIKPPSRYIEARTESTPETKKRKWSRKGPTTHLLEKNAQEFDMDETNDGVAPTIRFERRTIKPPPRYLQFRIETIQKPKKTPEVVVFEDELEFDCNIAGCTMSFNTEQELAVHKQNICTVEGCGKKVFSHKYLMVHRRVHTSERPLKCNQEGCTKTFKWGWSRTQHTRVHTGERPYKCLVEGCGMTFMFVSDFCRHKRMTGHSVRSGS